MAKSKFFCENCGAEVKHNAKVCPYCGRFFSAVRCPRCGFTGDASMFRAGCPNCGYAGTWGSGEGKGRRDTDFIIEPYDADSEGPGKRQAFPADRSRVQGWKKGKTQIPDWVYWLTIAILLVAVGVLVLLYLNL